ncbi:MAG: hypothetical protein AVDCRST_MAG13-2947, partial [uncultured Solirubrobacteraceae bacterium]
ELGAAAARGGPVGDAGLPPAGLHVRRRDPHPAAHGPARVRGRRHGGPAHGLQPADDLPGDLRRHGPGVAAAVVGGSRDHVDQPAADAHPHHAADPHRVRGRLRVPGRPLQHRRPGPVHGGRDHRRLGRLLARRPAGLAAHRRRDRARGRRRRAVGGDRGHPARHRRGQRGDLDDHAQLHRPVGGLLPLRPRRAAAERRRPEPARVERHRRERAAARVLGRPGAPGPARRDLHRARRGRRLLGHPQPVGQGLRGARRRLQPGRRGLRRHQRGPDVLHGHGHLRRLRRPGGRHQRPGLAVPGGHERHRGLPVRLPGDRRGPARAQHRARHGPRRAAVRRAAAGHERAQPGSDRLRPAARGQPDDDHPGARGADRQRRRPGDLLLPAAAPAQGAAGRGPRPRLGLRGGVLV